MNYKLRDNFTTNSFNCLEDILKNRGVQDVQNFMHPSAACENDPFLLDNIELAAKTLLFHLQENSKIIIIIDADADGYTSSAILWLYIKSIYPNANLSFTIHDHKQHGLEDKIHWILGQDFNLVICPDAASFDVQYHQMLHEAGIECICLDHHSILQDDNGIDILPNEEYAIVVNNQLSKNYPNKSLCGAGIVYKFCEVLDSLLHINKAQEYLDLVALGEIADVMDKTDIETNYLMQAGLSNIRNEGLKVLLASQEFSLKEKALEPWPGLNTINIAFYISPLINAITRVGSMADKEALFYCFIEPNKPLQSTKRGAKSGDIELAAEQAARVGKNAKSRQDKFKEKAVDLIDFKIQKDDLNQNNILIIELDDNDDIPSEMTGLIAMNVVSKYHKPVMIGRRNFKNELKGSIRSDSNFKGLPSFKKFLEDSGLMNYVAGHDGAAGWSLNAAKLTTLINYANTHLNAADFENCYLVDYVLSANNDNYDLLETLASYPEYFGNHIDEITLIIKDISLANILVMGGDKSSLKIPYNGIDYVKFKDANFIEQVQQNRLCKLTVYGKPNLNTFNGRTTVQIIISDYELVKDESRYEF